MISLLELNSSICSLAVHVVIIPYAELLIALQLETFDRVKEKMSSSSTTFSLARQRLQRANTGLNGRPPSAGKSEASPSTTAEAEGAAITPRSPFQAASSRTPDRTRASPMRTTRQELTSEVDLSPSKQSPVSPVPNRGPAAQQTSIKAPVNPPLSHPALSGLSSSKQQAEPRTASGLTGVGSVGGPLTPERLPSGRMMSGRLPSGLAMTDGEPGQNLKPISTARSLSRGVDYVLQLLHASALQDPTDQHFLRMLHPVPLLVTALLDSTA